MTTVGRYELRETIGVGGFATVHRAWDPALRREVALKALLPRLAADPVITRRFLTEARALARLRHPNIVTVHDVGETERGPFFTMELIDGHTLSELIGDGGRLPLARVAAIMTSLCDAIDYLHRAGAVHRDVKAPNVMVERSGRVVLMDFGLVRTSDRTELTQTGMLLGTPEYMAPEQVRGGPIGPAVDIYALGVLTYQLLSGQPPFSGDTLAVLYAHVNEPPPPAARRAAGPAGPGVRGGRGSARQGPGGAAGPRRSPRGGACRGGRHAGPPDA